MKYYLIAGEASGDLHGSNLMRSIKNRDEEADFRFLGGDLMQAQGGVLVKHYREMAYMGIIPVIRHADKIWANMKSCKKDIVRYRPDVVILIDYPGFNLQIAKFVKKHLDIPVHYYISPKVWAWKEYRVKSFKKYVDEMLCILPFEVDFYKKHRYRVHYVGNPIVDALAARDHQDEPFPAFITQYGLDNKPIIALLPGSRKREIEANLPVMLRASESFRNYQVIIAGAPGIEPDFYDTYADSYPLNVTVLFQQTYRILAQARAALVTSGTATLETALLNVPQVVCYQTAFPKLSYWAFRHILHTPYISLVNLIAGKEVVKELFAVFFSERNIQKELDLLLNDDAYRQTMLGNYEEMRQFVGGPGASDRAAAVIVDAIRGE
ncbi:MAG TPA: lipid-A-disaccharide synthase [Porphyromonadaceae bacterium]|nr:lipid-A-disaccharide synthase [Porphyromonadaceae bacterium]